MYRAFGFSFNSVKGLILFVILLVFFVLAYHALIQASIRNDPESTRKVIREHCHYMLGKQLTQDDFADKFERCDDFSIKSVAAAGGIFDPVIVKITLDEQHPLLGKDVFIFKTIVLNFNFLSGLHGLASGTWEFNFYNTYSNFMFKGSI